MDVLSTSQLVILSVGWAVACFFIYNLLLHAPGLENWFVRRYGPNTGRLRQAIAAKVFGSVMMGIGTLWLTYELFGPLFDEILGLYWHGHGWPEHISLLIMAVLMVFISYRRRNEEALFAAHPETRLYSWNADRLWIYLTAWLIYLIGYEILFRGLLLLALIPYLGLYWALGIHVVIYTLAHVHKGRQELIGSAVFGLVIGYFCAITASIVPAMLLHIIISLSTNYYAIRNSKAYHN